MRRRDFISSVGAMAVWPLTAHAQQPKAKVIGFLLSRSGTGVLDPFEGAMRSLGYIQGKDYRIEARYADNQYERFPSLAIELVELKVDGIVATASPGIRAAQRSTS